ncbi:MAG TPA: SCO family protein [Steroidobacteraceae bacterium]|nr:SCO family protein [Steroidobacteraceae bacterium]
MKVLLTCALLLAASLVSAASPEAAPGPSLYDLSERLSNQDGAPVGLDVHRGNKVLVSMFYSSCPATCPLIIDTLRAVERGLDSSQRSDLRVLMISFDPARDTAEALRELAKTRRIDTQRWTLARADDAAVRRIAAALEIQYRHLPDGQISHSNVITALGRDGKILARSTEIGHADESLVRALATAP